MDYIRKRPELHVFGIQRLVLPGVFVAAAISHPDVHSGVGQHETEALVGQVVDPSHGAHQVTVLQQHNGSSAVCMIRVKYEFKYRITTIGIRC